MKIIKTILGAVIGISLGIYGSLSFALVLTGNFDWNEPYALWIALGAIIEILLIAGAAFHFKQVHRNAFGMIEILIGCVILFSQIGGSDVNRETVAVKFLAALFFLVQGFENWRADRFEVVR